MLVPLVLLSAIILLLYRLYVPYYLPRNIPTIPLWVTLYDAWRGIPRAKFYDIRVRKHMETYGAVNLWHLGRWTVLVTKPELVSQIFRHNDTFVKGGNIKKIPNGAAARLFGVNIIDSHGSLWKLFTEIIKPGIQRPFDVSFIKQTSASLVQHLVRDQEQAPHCGVRVDSLLQRWAISIFSEYFLDLDSQQIKDSMAPIQHVLDLKKTSLTVKVFFIFPFLERVHWLFPSGRRGFAIVDQLEKILMDLIEMPDDKVRDENKMIPRLKRAYAEGRISEYYLRSNLKQLFVAGVENTEMVLNSVMWELARRPGLQGRLREEIRSVPETYSEAHLDNLPLLTATIYETMRLYPPLLSLINRYTSEPVCLGSDMPIPAGTWVGWHAYGTQTDPNVWGPSAHEFDPDRWGQDIDAVKNMFRTQQARGKFLPFATHARKCLGMRFAIVQLKIALCEMLRTVEWSEDKDYQLSLLTVRA